MAAELIIAPEAERDIDAAYSWYEVQRVGLGEEFLSCVDSCLQGIRRNPEGHRVVYEHYRRALVRRFPFAVFYEYTAAVVTVFCTFHTSREPEKWRRRLP